jgi:hypothetical protein
MPEDGFSLPRGPSLDMMEAEEGNDETNPENHPADPAAHPSGRLRQERPGSGGVKDAARGIRGKYR